MVKNHRQKRGPFFQRLPLHFLNFRVYIYVSHIIFETLVLAEIDNAAVTLNQIRKRDQIDSYDEYPEYGSSCEYSQSESQSTGPEYNLEAELNITYTRLNFIAPFSRKRFSITYRTN